MGEFGVTRGPWPRVGVVLLHGFGGRLDAVRPWADHLREAGHQVETPLLPGHGTTWQDHARTTWADWYGHLVEVFERLRDEHEHVVVGGLSLGGSLCLRLAADRLEEVAGVMVVNPAVEMHRRLGWLTPVLKHVVPSVPAAVRDDIKEPGTTERSYERTSVRAGHSAMQAMGPLREALPRITAPLLYFRSAEDHVVSDRSHQIVLGAVSSRDTTLHVLRDSYHVATLDHDAPLIHQASSTFVERVTTPALADHL